MTFDSLLNNIRKPISQNIRMLLHLTLDSLGHLFLMKKLYFYASTDTNSEN